MEKINREHTALNITRTQRKNLIKLRNYLLKRKLKASFSMQFYCESKADGRSGSRAVSCGSVGCAVGHGPYAGIPKRSVDKWKRYEEISFGTGDGSQMSVFLFSYHWQAHDNTPQGVVNRINYVLEHGTPKCFHDRETNSDYVKYINEELNNGKAEQKS